LTINKLIQASFGISECMGDLLFMKHPCRDLDKIMDINDSDRAIINLIIRWKSIGSLLLHLRGSPLPTR
jgi:hypothetical protein